MKLSQRVRLLVSSFVVMSVAGVFALVACGPASQSGGGGSGSEEPEGGTVVYADADADADSDSDGYLCDVQCRQRRD